MKKTLVAVAALAVAGGAFAQSTVSLTGKFRAAYQAINSGAGGAAAKSNGFAVTDGDVVFSAVEDLGGGMKAGTSMAVRVRGRGVGVVDGRDATVYLTGGFGTVTVGAVEAGNGIIGLGGAGAPVIGLDDGTALAGAANVDLFQYTSPSMSGFNGYLQIVDSIGLPGAGGLQSGSTLQDATVLGANYNNGPINFNANYTSFGANSAAAPTADSRLRISGNYNLGVATVGLGYQSQENSAGSKDNQYILGVAAPFGPVTVGANLTRRSVTGGLKVTGYDVGASYNLSKRTYVNVAYKSVDSNAAVDKATQFRIQLAHSF